MNKQQTNDFDKIILTAFMVSLARQFTDIPYAKELAQLIETQGLVKLSQPQNQDKSVLLTARVEARYKAINQVVAQYQITQVLELASGLLPRGLFMSSNPNITFIESDLPNMIRCKQQLVQQLVGERPNLHFIEIDATSSSPSELCGVKGKGERGKVLNPLPFNPSPFPSPHQAKLTCQTTSRPSEFSKSTPVLNTGQPVMILCEGLLTHLTLVEKQLVCANIRDMLHSYGGVWITPDFIDTGSLVRSQQDDSGLQKLLQRGTNLTGRSLINNNFGTLDQSRQFVYEQGFRVIEHSMLNVIDELSCLEILGADLEVVRKMLATQSVFALTLDVA